jgi:predicted nucleic acid-binding protein
MATAAPGFLVLDACVLIDYSSTDKSILALISQHVGRVHVPRQLLEEVKALDKIECDRLGLRVFEPELELLNAAGRHRSGLSFEDRICLLVAKRSGWTCVTSDKKLRRECVAERVPVLWGLEPMIALVRSGHLAVAEAKKAALRIQRGNPLFITDAVIEKFIRRIETARRAVAGRR